MSTFKLNVLSTLIAVFSLVAITTVYAHNELPTNEVNQLEGNPIAESSDAMVHWVQITAPVNSNIRYLSNMPMTIGAAADNIAGDLVSLVLLVDGTLAASGTSASLTSTYTPTSAGQYLLEAVATYSDGSQVSTQMNFNVMGGGIRQLLVPMQILIP